MNKLIFPILIIQTLIIIFFINYESTLNRNQNIISDAIDKIKPCVVGINVKQVKRKKTIWNS